MVKDRPNGRRRAVALIAALSLGLMGVGMLPSPAGGEEAEDFITGSGQAYAQIYRAGPTAGRLSLAPIFGLSLADYLNTVGRGETKVADWAGIGVAERSLPDNTPALKIASTDEGASEGVTEYVAGDGGSGIGEMYVRATREPLGESRFRLSTLSVPGIIEMRDSESHTITGIVADGLREARAVTEVGRMSIGGGAVTLSGLRWETLQRSGSEDTATGSFTVEGVSIGGVPVPMPGGPSDLEALLGPINSALEPTGFAITLPELQVRSGQANLSPLSIDIINSPMGRQYLAPLLDSLQPARAPVADAFIDLAKQLAEADEAAPDASVAVLAADLTLGIFSGSSQLHIEVGGVSAYTEGERFDSLFGRGATRPPAPAPETITIPGIPGTPAIPGIPPVPVEEAELVTAPVAPGTTTVPGDRGGVAVAVGLIGLAVAAGLAVADWYRMRRSARAAVPA